MVFQDLLLKVSGWNRDPLSIPVCAVWCEKRLQQCSATSPRCTEVVETTQNGRLKLTLFDVCVYVYMSASNCATLNNTHFILLHEYINPMN